MTLAYGGNRTLYKWHIDVLGRGGDVDIRGMRRRVNTLLGRASI